MKSSSEIFLEAQRRWHEENDAKARDTVVPDPEVRATRVGVHDGRVGRGAATIHNLAKKHGWMLRMTYARGPIMHGTTREFLRMVDSIMIRGVRGDENFTAVWLDNGFDFAYVGPQTENPRRVNSAALKETIKHDPTTALRAGAAPVQDGVLGPHL